MSLGHAILAVLATRSATGYELNKVFDPEMAFFWSATHQQIYRELKRLNAEGLVRFSTVGQRGRPDKKVYSLTEAGREELTRWSAGPLETAPVRDTLLARLLASHVADLDALQAELRRECERLREKVEALEAYAQRSFQAQQPGGAGEMPLYRTMHSLVLRGVVQQDRARLAFCAEVLEALGRGTAGSDEEATGDPPENV
jgi:DNA-binding PadR family transcriptional regulator